MLKPSLQLRQGLQLTMTPQLQQAIRLLQLPVMDLQTKIQDALESNMMLEPVEEYVDVRQDEQEAPAPDDAGRDEVMTEEEWREPQLTASADGGRQSSGEPRLNQDIADSAGQTLQEYLLEQVQLEDFHVEEALVAHAIIDAINDDGYLIDDFETLCQTLADAVRVTPADIEPVLEKVQSLDPPGVGARDIGECLELQLRQLDPATEGLEIARRIVQEHLELLGEHQYGTIRRRLNASDEELERALALVRSLHPRPGAAVQPRSTEYVVPDVFVRKFDGRWIVDVNTALLPQLRVNQSYAGLIRRSEDHTILRTQLQEARWLVRSLEIRNDTLLRVARCIVERQRAFLDQGEEAMVPLVLRDVAEELGMHESTISRVTTSKYMHTPRGVFEFRYFFSSHVGTVDGQERSSTAIRAMIRKLIAAENAAKPLSDNKIAQQLLESGVNVARRTVAKYREAMSIPSSSERKRLAPRREATGGHDAT